MSTGTSIEWTDATWNPTVGCSRVSAGCERCYAERFAHRFSGVGQRYEGLTVLGKQGPRWTGEVRLVPARLADPLAWKRPRRIFVNSMSDLFHEKLSDEGIAAVFGVMAAAKRHTFQVLTKRPERMRSWFDWVSNETTGLMTIRTSARLVCASAAWKVMGHSAGSVVEPSAWPLPNVWIGVSVEDQKTADERIPMLLQTPAAVRWVSYEPALGPIDFERVQWPQKHRVDVLRGGTWELGQGTALEGFCNHSDMETVDWIVVGGESGPGARPFNLAWARSTLDQCRAAGVPAFFKQAGARPFDGADGQRCDGEPHEWAWLKLRDRKGGDLSELPEDLRVRQMPEARR